MKNFTLLLLSLTLLCATALGQTSEEKVILKVPLNEGWLWYGKHNPEIKVVAYNTGDTRANENITLTLSTDKKKQIKELKKKISIPAKDSTFQIFKFKVDPGFYRVLVSSSKGEIRKFNIGYEPERIISPVDAQPDLKEFWYRAKSELAGIVPDYRLVIQKDSSTEKRNVYVVTMRSLENVEISGYYVTPVKPGKYPAIIGYMGYGSKPWCPKADDNPDFVEFVLSVRGQARQEPTNIYGDWITWNLQDKDKYYYRGAFMDLVRAIDFVASRPEVDTNCIFTEGGSQGGAFTLAACALDSRIRAGAPFIPFLSDYPDYFKIVDWPATPVLARQKELGISDKDLYTTLSYFDIKNLAGWIKCPILMGFGLQDETCPPHTNFAGYNLIKAPKNYICYPLKGHDVENGWWQKRMEFFRQFINY